ncbi:NACHT domain-containing protein [Flavobacterium tibetense]|uniref:NACHT domain-containing protein n=1 Tax=Flavobacterium tibetense TaxID=2233533 RepID=A0A365P2X9_9FLAO|nr:hypothetical protein [Flavobacterium tibetense]RBA28881.1 hypothetical protein DPN68_05710 [Flavobacterium tibetense]
MEILSTLWNWFLNQGNILFQGLTITTIIATAYKLSITVKNFIKEKKEGQDLFPFYNQQTISDAKKNYIRTKCQNIDPANDLNYKNSHAFSTKEDLLNFFLKKVFKIKDNETRFYLILGDSGMGKSTFMLNLFSRHSSIFRISFHRRPIKLLPLGENYNVIKDYILKIENPSKTILLLDGFDEVPLVDNETIKEKFDEIINLVKDFHLIIITCRTQFFTSEKDEPFELKIKKFNTDGNGYHIVKKLYISPFDKRNIRQYINKTFHFYEISKKRKAFKIINETNDLMVRPMLLSYIKDIIETDKKNLTTIFDVYEALIINWLKRESNKYEQEKRIDFRMNLIFFSYEVANYIYNNYESNGIYIPLEVAQKISSDFKINLNDIEIKSRSLLNRNSLGNYKFSHKSIYEFFLAYLAYRDRKLKGDIYIMEYNFENYDQAKKFISDIVHSNRVKFALPRPDEREERYNVELYSEIVKKRNLKGTIELKWLKGNSFIILKKTADNQLDDSSSNQ